MKGWGVDPDGQPGAFWVACLEAAVAAPSIHNTQPWRFRLHPGSVDVYADPRRRLGVLDSTGRELSISVGAAVLNLRIAILHHGRTPVTTLYPDQTQPHLAARIALGPATAAPASASLLARAIPRRHTNRRPFSDTPVPGVVENDMREAAAAEGAGLVTADATISEAVLFIVRAAERQWRANPQYWGEIDQWTRASTARVDGVPPSAFGPRDAIESVPIRDFGLTGTSRHRRTAPFEANPALAVLYTEGDSPHAWVRAGMALERVLLTATVHGLSTTLMTQPLEVPRLRSMLADTAAGRSAQAIIRYGYGQPVAPSPRRPLSDFLMTSDAAAATANGV